MNHRIALCQLNFTVGAITANTHKIIEAAQRAKAEGAKIAVFPELALSGYPPEDLLFRNDFYLKINKGLEDILKSVSGIYLVLGYPAKDANGRCYNRASVLYNGKILASYDKQMLPNHSVFDERRYFEPGAKPCVVDIEGVQYGLLICEDLWSPEPIAQAKQAGAQIILSPNASPFSYRKPDMRLNMLKQRVKEAGLPIVYVNLIGGQDELVFDGGSMIIDATGTLTTQANYFKEAVTTTSDSRLPTPDQKQSIYQALTLGTKDYLGKNGFSGAIIGLSGGIDSALTLAIAVDALGAENVEAVMMPSEHTSQMSLEDAKGEAEALGVEYSIISITDILGRYLTQLGKWSEVGGRESGVTYQNLQARIRGNLLMALSNASGKLVLTTGNKSEMAVGYATLYGDMCGGLAVIKDVPKTMVYQLANYRNSIAPVIPERVITRPPSAELAPNQVDEDSLPPYDILDQVIERYVEQDQSVEEIIAAGFDAATVNDMLKLIKRNEYKRHQAAPGIRITERAFGKDRRYPITNG